MDRIIFPEWRAENENTRYPFSLAATMIGADGTTVVDGFLLDAIIHPVGGLERMYLSSAVIDHREAVLYIGDAANPTRCSGKLQLPNPGDTVELTDAYGRPAGLLVSESNRLAGIQAWGVGTHTFEADQTEFAATVCIPTPEIGLRGVLLDSGELLTGEIWLVGSDGVVLRADSVLTPTKRGGVDNLEVVRVDVVGDPLFRRKLCTPASLFATPRFIKAVRIVHPDGEFTCIPDAQGNLTISSSGISIADSSLRVRTTPGGVLLEVVGTAN